MVSDLRNNVRVYEYVLGAVGTVKSSEPDIVLAKEMSPSPRRTPFPDPNNVHRQKAARSQQLHVHFSRVELFWCCPWANMRLIKRKLSCTRKRRKEEKGGRQLNR